jgi:putative phosphoesterase
MRIAVISDIHGNLTALEAVLEDIARRGLEGILHLGDLVGYGPRPEEAAARIREAGIHGVVGNYDLAVCGADEEKGLGYLKAPVSPPHRASYLRTRERTGGETRRYLLGLPAQIRIEEEEKVFLFVHGSPERPNEYLPASTPEERLRELFDGTGADVLVTGHTHVPLARPVGERLHLNPGSVGLPRDGDPRAAYLILDTTRGFRAEEVRVTFDVESVARDCVISGFPIEQAEMFRTGRSL